MSHGNFFKLHNKKLTLSTSWRSDSLTSAFSATSTFLSLLALCLVSSFRSTMSSGKLSASVMASGSSSSGGGLQYNLIIQMYRTCMFYTYSIVNSGSLPYQIRFIIYRSILKLNSKKIVRHFFFTFLIWKFVVP